MTLLAPSTEICSEEHIIIKIYFNNFMEYSDNFNRYQGSLVSKNILINIYFLPRKYLIHKMSIL